MAEGDELNRDHTVRHRINAWADDSLPSESEQSHDSSTNGTSETTGLPDCENTTSVEAMSRNTNPNVLNKLVWTDLIEHTRRKVVRHLDEQLDTALTGLVMRIDEREKYLRGFNWHSDYLQDKRCTDGSTSNKNLMDKVFCHRDSILTVLFEISHIRTVYHMFIAILVIFSLNAILVDLLDHENSMFTYDLDIFRFAFGGFHEVVTCWFSMQLSTMFIPFLGFVIWCTKRPAGGKVVNFDWCALACFMVYQILFIVLPIRFILDNRLPPASTAIVVLEQVRMFMKSHAFVRSSAEVVFEKQAASERPGTSNSVDRYSAGRQPWCPDFSHYLYFLFVPTLVYRDSYPRTNSIRWSYVATNLFQVAGCVLLSYYIFVRFCFNEFVNFGRSTDYTLRQFILTSSATSLPGGLVMLLAFFAALHSWMNAFAEMFRFGDRLFYKDWWNSTAFSTWYRTWNVVVHDWLYIYMYRDLQLLAPTRSRKMATAVVFWVSAIVHEYVLSLVLRFVYPVLFMFFACAGYPFIYLKGSGRGWNVFIWVLLFIGWGQMMCLYSMEWYARKNCQPVLGSWVDAFIPHSWFCRPLNRTNIG